MKLKNTLRAVAAASVIAAGSASAAEVVLDFEGIANGAAVGDYYNGAVGGGTNYGVSFSPATLASIDCDVPGVDPSNCGNFANEPSPSTIMFFTAANNAILTVAAGFMNRFSFFYSSAVAANITVWDGLDGTGNLLATIAITAQAFDSCSGDPNGAFCNWTNAGAMFHGVARSINFGGAANQTGFDNITFGVGTPGSGGVPEPMSLALVGAALLGLAASRRNKA